MVSERKIQRDVRRAAGERQHAGGVEGPSVSDPRKRPSDAPVHLLAVDSSGESKVQPLLQTLLSVENEKDLSLLTGTLARLPGGLALLTGGLY